MDNISSLRLLIFSYFSSLILSNIHCIDSLGLLILSGTGNPRLPTLCADDPDTFH